MKIITEPKELIARYVSRLQNREMNTHLYSTLGLLNGDDELVAGVVYNGYEHPNILLHVSVEFVTPAFIAAMLHYPFVQLGCTRITGIIPQLNVHSRQFAEHIGGKLEGTMIKAAPNGDNYCIYGMQVEDAQRWLTPRYLKKLERAFA